MRARRRHQRKWRVPCRVSQFVDGTHSYIQTLCDKIPARLCTKYKINICIYICSQVPGTWYAIRTSQRVHSYTHTSTCFIKSYTYINSTQIVWYQVVIYDIPIGACGKYSAYHHQAPRTQTGSRREQRWIEVQWRGLHKRPRGRNGWSCGGVRGPRLDAYTNTPTHKGRKNHCIKEKHAVGKRSGIFLTGTCTQAIIRHGVTSSICSEFCSTLLELVGMRRVTEAFKRSNS